VWTYDRFERSKPLKIPRKPSRTIRSFDLPVESCFSSRPIEMRSNFEDQYSAGSDRISASEEKRGDRSVKRRNEKRELPADPHVLADCLLVKCTRTRQRHRTPYEFLPGAWGKVVMSAIIGDFSGIPQYRQKGQPQMTQQTFQH
jgi:hypothetical protein